MKKVKKKKKEKERDSRRSARDGTNRYSLGRKKEKTPNGVVGKAKSQRTSPGKTHERLKRGIGV